MATVNQQVSLPQVQKTMMNFEKETAKMDMAGELSESLGSLHNHWSIVYIVVL